MKNIDYIIKKTAMDLEMPEEKVREVISFYWKDIKGNMDKLEHEAIFIKNLGTIYVPYLPFRRYLESMIKSYRNNPKEYKLSLIKRMLFLRNKLTKKFYNRWKK